jgi:OPA family glycerol-3-phosphate transporter-like MFS transporter
MSLAPAAPSESPVAAKGLPPGYGARRGLNWSVVGLLYTSFYMCRYNLSIANKAMSDEFHFSKGDMGDILGAQFYAYAFGQVINGLITDRLGGKKALLIGAAGTVAANVAFGFASFWGMLWLFILLRGIDGYAQSVGSPGFIKVNASWFSTTERGSFAGVFGFMINLGRVAINQLGPALLAGFVFLGMWKIPAQHWRMLFFVPAAIATVVAVALAIWAKDTPEEAGFHGVFRGEADHDDNVKADMREVFLNIVLNKYVWIMAAAYACTGAVRQTVDQWFPRYMQDAHKLNLDSPLVSVALFMIPLVASAGSFISGIISDQVFGGRRAPVAAGIYCLEVITILVASRMTGATAIVVAFVTVAFTANSTHSLLGPAAAMDIGGRKAAAFASGCINSFQYLGAGAAMQLIGRLLDKTGYDYFFYFMVPWAVVGAVLMFSMAGQRNLRRGGAH